MPGGGTAPKPPGIIAAAQQAPFVGNEEFCVAGNALLKTPTDRTHTPRAITGSTGAGCGSEVYGLVGNDWSPRAEEIGAGGGGRTLLNGIIDLDVTKCHAAFLCLPALLRRRFSSRNRCCLCNCSSSSASVPCDVVGFVPLALRRQMRRTMCVERPVAALGCVMDAARN